MKFTNRPNQKFKTTCGKDMWKTRAVAVVVTLLARVSCLDEKVDNVYVLVGKRGTGVNAEQGKWCLPCGYLDWDESGTQAAVRELFEETNVDVGESLRHWLTISDPDMDPRQNVCLHYGKMITVNSLPVPSNVNCEPNEVDELKWVTVEEASQMELAFGHARYPKMFLYDQLSHEW